MHNFILKNRPLSFNSCRGSKKIKYKNQLENSFTSYNSNNEIFNEQIYALIYYFYKVDLDIDTDNISKPLWDCLNGFLFEVDQQIKFRIAGSFDISAGDYNIIDFTGLQGDILVDLFEAFDTEEHIIYIECGKYNPTMLKFNIE